MEDHEKPRVLNGDELEFVNQRNDKYVQYSAMDMLAHAGEHVENLARSNAAIQFTPDILAKVDIAVEALFDAYQIAGTQFHKTLDEEAK